MNNDLRATSAKFLKLHENFERISQSLQPSYMDFYMELDRSLHPIRQLHLAGCGKTRVEGDCSAPTLLTRAVDAHPRWGRPRGSPLWVTMREGGTVSAHIAAYTRLRIRTRLYTATAKVNM